MFAIPVFLYQVFYMLFASAIPVLLILWIVRRFINSGKKTYRSVRN